MNPHKSKRNSHNYHFNKAALAFFCSQLLCVFEGRAVRASSIDPRIPRNPLHERESFNQSTIHTDFLQELQTVLSNCSGTLTERVVRESRGCFNFRVATWTLLHPSSPVKHVPLWIYPSLTPSTTCRRGPAFAAGRRRGRRRGPEGQEQEAINRVALDEPSARLC